MTEPNADGDPIAQVGISAQALTMRRNGSILRNTFLSIRAVGELARLLASLKRQCQLNIYLSKTARSDKNWSLDALI